MIVSEKDLNVKKARNFYDLLNKEMENNTEIVIDVSAVNRIDLAIVQVIISAGRKAKQTGRVIKLRGVCGQVKKQLQIGGLKI